MFVLTRTGETLKSNSLRAYTLGAATSAWNPKSALALTGSARTSTRGALTSAWNPKSVFALIGSARTSIRGVLKEMPALKLLL